MLPTYLSVRTEKGAAPIPNATADVEVAVHSSRLALAPVMVGLVDELVVIMLIRAVVRERSGQAGIGSHFQKIVVLSGASMTLERALRIRLERTFNMVGPALAAYMICDWQLWLWMEGLTAVFATLNLHPQQRHGCDEKYR